MHQNQRRHLRKVPEELAFIQIERDEVGRVLDVSEGGLSFNSFGPIAQHGPLYFWFSFDLQDRIEAMGELAWTDSTKKVGGLRFTQLSKSGREKIREWLSRLPTRAVASKEPGPRVVPDKGQGKTGPIAADRLAKFVGKARPRTTRLSLNPRDQEDFVAPASAPAPVPEPVLENAGPSAELVPRQRHLSVKKHQLIRGMLLGIGISAAVMVSAVKYSDYRHHTENAASVRAEAVLVKNDAPPPDPDAPQPVSTATAPAPDIFAPSKQSKGIASNSISSKQVATPHPYTQTHRQTFETRASSLPARTHVPAQSSGALSRGTKSISPPQLWAAVQAGNTKAAVELAELYIKGEGVPQNCQQARVLLLVASERRNPAAIKRLQELDKDKDACP